jgi:uncharacterized protein YhhL (DUF1145 family)
MDVILEKMEKRRSVYNLMMVIIVICTFILIIIINSDSSTEVKINQNKVNIFIIGVSSILCIAIYWGNKKIEKKFLEDYNNMSLKDKEIIEKGMRAPEVELKNVIMTDVALLAMDRFNCVLIFYRDITKVAYGRLDRI